MKKLSVLLTLMMMVSILFAQEKKEVVLIGDIKCSFENSEQISKNVHDVIVQSFVEKKLQEVIDINTLPAIGQEIYRQTGEGAMNEENLLRLKEAGVKGADWVVTGTLSNFDATASKDEKGKLIGYDGVVNFVFKVTSLRDGTVKGTKSVAGKTFICVDTKDAAIMKSIQNTKKKVLKEIVAIFPPTGFIVEIPTVKKKEARTIVLEIGAAKGVTKGDVFKVCEKINYRGKVRIKEIGKVRVTEVQGDDFCVCKVTKGGDIILKDFNEEKEIYAEQLPRMKLGDIAGDLL